MKKILKTSIMMLILMVVYNEAFAASKTENIFYYYPSPAGYKSVEANHKNIDVLAPQIYTVGYDMQLGVAENSNILELAKSKKLKVMPLVVQSNFNKALMSQILNDEKIQDKIIKDLIREAQDKKFIGWQFDFENINHLDRDLYTNFVKKAYKSFRKKKLILSVAVVPRTKDYDKNSWDQDWSSGNDIPELAKVSDFISFMTYDDPLSYGPVASIDYVQKVLDYNISKKISPKKISLGVPLYCWQWETTNTSNKKISNPNYETALGTKEKYKNNNFFSSYSNAAEAELFSFIKDDGSHHSIWCDNAKSLSAKNNLIKKYKLRGFSAWAIGQEDKNIWGIL